MMIRLLLVAVFCGLPWSVEAVCTESPAGTWTADDHTVAEILECYNDAGFDSGNTIIAPAGDGAETWTAGITLSSKNVILRFGDGSGGFSQTEDVTITYTGTAPIIGFGDTCSQLSGVKITSSSTGTGTWIDGGKGCATFRIHHSEFENTAAAPDKPRVVSFNTVGTADTWAIALIDHNYLKDARIQVNGYDTVGYTPPARNWGAATDPGSPNRVYIEDNVIDLSNQGGNSIEADSGGCYVARFNTMISATMHGHGAANGAVTQAHRGARCVEWYANDFSGSANSESIMWLRSGAGMIWGNTIATEVAGSDIMLDTHRTAPNPCDGSYTVDGNDGSGSTYPGAGWPCWSSPGRGQDQSTDVDGLTWVDSAVDPIGFWLNRTGGALTPITLNGVVPNVEDHIADCHEYQQEDSTFDGTCGTGVGVSASKPATCTATSAGVPGTAAVYYWATDEGSWNDGSNAIYTGDGRLYKCTATNTWTLYYTPYTYPHPQQGVAAAGSVPFRPIRRGVPLPGDDD
jgi:hypothetical protein